MKQLLTVRDICRRLQLGRTTVYGLVKDNKLPAVRLARRLRFDEDLVEKHIREHALTPLVASQIPAGRESPGEGPPATNVKWPAFKRFGIETAESPGSA
jgi:excisionase family DNA binding protein